MAAVHEPHDDTASISSVPDSHFGSDSEPDEGMGTALGVPSNVPPATSAKAREAQAESSRARQGAVSRQQQQTQPSARDPAPPSPTRSAALATPSRATLYRDAAATDPDDVPPPPYSEALRQESRPDDAVRYAWRRGIAEGSLDMDSFNRLVSPSIEGGDSSHNEQNPTSPPTADQHVDLEAQNQDEQQGADPDAAEAAPGYGSIGRGRGGGGRGGRRGRSGRRGGRGRHSGHDHHHHDEQGYRQHGDPREMRSGYHRVPDHYDGTSSDTSDPSDDELAERRLRRKSSRGRSGWCGLKRNDAWYGKWPNWWDEWNQRREEKRRQRLKKLAWLMVFVIIAVILFVPVVCVADHLADGIANIKKMHKSKNGTPDDGANSPGDPTNPGQVLPGDPSEHRDSFCSGAVWTRFWDTSLEPKDGDLRFWETLTHPRYRGTIRLVAAPSSQLESVKASVAYALNPRFRIGSIGFEQSEDGLHLLAPTYNPSTNLDHDLSCADIDVVFSIKSTTALRDLVMSTSHLAISVDKRLFCDSASEPGLHVQNSTLLETTHGKVSVDYASSKDLYVHTQSGRVEGNFALYNHLRISTTSGAIDIIVEPQPAPKDDPSQPAELSIESVSGRIEAFMPTSGDIPNRNYKTFVSTKSSSIAGDYIFGEIGDFSSYSGRLEADLLPFVFQLPSGATQPEQPAAPSLPEIPAAPVPPKAPSAPVPPVDIDAIIAESMPDIDAIVAASIPDIDAIVAASIPDVDAIVAASMPAFDANKATSSLSVRTVSPFQQSLKTDLTSSATQITLLEPYFSLSSKAQLHMTSSHSSKSGAVHLVYPRAWTGTIDAESTSGKIQVSGSGLERIRSVSRRWSGLFEKGRWRRRADRGDGTVGDSSIGVKTISARVELSFRS